MFNQEQRNEYNRTVYTAKTVRFAKDLEQHLIEHVNNQKNQAQYIKDLISDDLARSNDVIEDDYTYVSMQRLKDLLYSYNNRKGEDAPTIQAWVEYSSENSTNGNWDRECDKAERTYCTDSNAKAVLPNVLGYSMFGRCEGGTHEIIDLTKFDWIIEHCYLKTTDYCKIVLKK